MSEGSSGGKLPVVPPFSLSSLHPLSISWSWQGFVTPWCYHTFLCQGYFTSGGAFKWKYCCSAHVLLGSSWGVIKPDCHPCTQKPHYTNVVLSPLFVLFRAACLKLSIYLPCKHEIHLSLWSRVPLGGCLGACLGRCAVPAGALDVQLRITASTLIWLSIWPNCQSCL